MSKLFWSTSTFQRHVTLFGLRSHICCVNVTCRGLSDTTPTDSCLVKHFDNPQALKLKQSMVDALESPSTNFKCMHSVKPLFESREHQVIVLKKAILETLNKDNKYMFLNGTNGIGKSELIKNLVCRFNKGDEIGAQNVRAIYVSADCPSIKAFKTEFSIAFGLRRQHLSDLGFDDIANLAQKAIKSMTKEKDKQLAIFIDDIDTPNTTEEISYLNQLETLAKKLSQIENVCVVLVGCDGTTLLSMKSLTKTRCIKKTMSKFNFEEMTDFVLYKMKRQKRQENLPLAKELARIITKKYSFNLQQVEDALIAAEFDTKRLEIVIEQKKELLRREFVVWCKAAVGIKGDVNYINNVKRVIDRRNPNGSFGINLWQCVESDFWSKSSLAYTLLLNNYMVYIPEKKQFSFPDPCVTDMITSTSPLY